jgi:thiosulfate/3-mercaptopyruvate sulfurtransferase
MSDSHYAHPEVLVSTEWLSEHLNEPNTRIVESNEDVLLYDTGHIPGAVHIDWRQDLQDQLVRDYISPGDVLQEWHRPGYDRSLLR